MGLNRIGQFAGIMRDRFQPTSDTPSPNKVTSRRPSEKSGFQIASGSRLRNPPKQCLHLGRQPARAAFTLLRLDESAYGVQVRHDRAEEAGLASAGNQEGGEVLHFDGVHQVRFILDIHPAKLRLRKLGLQALEQRRIVLASAAPLGTQADDEQGRGGGAFWV